jgi:hypothetical protein
MLNMTIFGRLSEQILNLLIAVKKWIDFNISLSYDDKYDTETAGTVNTNVYLCTKYGRCPFSYSSLAVNS